MKPLPTCFLKNLPIELIRLILHELPAASVLNFRQCSSLIYDFTESDRKLIIPRLMKEELPMLWKLVERQPRTRRYRRRANTRGLPQKWADNTLRIVVATNMCTYGSKPPRGHIVAQFPYGGEPSVDSGPFDDGDLSDDGKSSKVIEFHAHDSSLGPGPVHMHRLVPYENPWKDEQNKLHFEQISGKVLKRDWEYLALMIHIHRKITTAALQLQDVVIPEIYLKGHDRSQWILDGLYLQWYGDLKKSYEYHFDNWSLLMNPPPLELE
ncbi:hypothetical protein MMC32_000002 [Xylographa parallela]|nr:hypothetical protein [Xylographa parallela]